MQKSRVQSSLDRCPCEVLNLFLWVRGSRFSSDQGCRVGKTPWLKARGLQGISSSSLKPSLFAGFRRECQSPRVCQAKELACPRDFKYFLAIPRKQGSYFIFLSPPPPPPHTHTSGRKLFSLCEALLGKRHPSSPNTQRRCDPAESLGQQAISPCIPHPGTF